MDTPSVYSFGSKKIVFNQNYNTTAHSWCIIKAIELLNNDGHFYVAKIADKYLLPMLEGVTFCDVWGDKDYDGSQILHYYCPDRPDQNYGYGKTPLYQPFKNATWDYVKHPFYGYENAATYAQNRYEAAKRAYLGKWGSNPQDYMAGWVVDKIAGQDDPISGRWANDTADIDNKKHRFGSGQTPKTAISDLLNNHTQSQTVFPQHAEKFLSKIFVPKQEVFDHSPEWLDDHFNNADDIVTYIGYDGHGSVIYAAWTNDTNGPMIFYTPVNSKENAFFLLGWALHLVQDCTLAVHTSDSSVFFLKHHDFEEDFLNEPLRKNIVWNGHLIKDALPAKTKSAFTDLFPWPPLIGNYFGINPASDYKERWYKMASPKVAYEYAKEAAMISHKYLTFVETSHEEFDPPGRPVLPENYEWKVLGFLATLDLDMAIKATAGVILNFLRDTGVTGMEGAMYAALFGRLP